jgi:CubicO group peptidase (beta-lactamase class C family)
MSAIACSQHFVRSGNLRVVILTSIFMLLIALVKTAAAQVPPIADKQLATLQTRLNLLTSKGFSGVVLIGRNDATLFEEAFGSVNDRQVQKIDLFWIASISKSFTAAAVMKCREQGLIRLDDHIARYLPDVPADKQTITISDLLSHTSGLPQSYASEIINDRDTAAQIVLKEQLVSSPGSKFNYSNANYELLAVIVERVSRRRFENYVRAELLQPLKLMHTGFWFDDGAKEVSPTRDLHPVRLKQRSWELGAGGMYSCADDLLHWSTALWAEKILTHESTQLMFSDHVKIVEGEAGFGWFHGTSGNGTEFWFTRGNDSFGPNALVYWYPTLHTTVVITSHAGDDKASDMGWSRIALSEVLQVLKF